MQIRTSSKRGAAIDTGPAAECRIRDTDTQFFEGRTLHTETAPGDARSDRQGTTPGIRVIPLPEDTEEPSISRSCHHKEVNPATMCKFQVYLRALGLAL